MSIELKDLHSLEIRERFQRNLSTIRKLFNWSAEELGNKIEVSKQSIWKWEKIDYDDDGHIKKPMTFAQYLTLYYIIQEELVNMQTENIERWIYVNGLCKLLMKEDNKEVEKKIAVYAEVNYASDELDLKNTLPLINGSIIKSSKNININDLQKTKLTNLESLKDTIDDKELLKEIENIYETRLCWMSYLIADRDLSERFYKLNDLITEIIESIKNKTFAYKYKQLLERYNDLDKEFAKITECDIKLINMNIYYTYTATLGVMSFTKLFLELFTCSKEEAILIIKKILLKDQEYAQRVLSKNYCYEDYKKDKFCASIMGWFKNVDVLDFIEQWAIINNIEKDELKYMADYFMKMSDKNDDVTEKVSSKEKEYDDMLKNEYSHRTKDVTLSIINENTKKMYGDIEKKFIETYGDRGDEFLERFVNLGMGDNISLAICNDILNRM